MNDATLSAFRQVASDMGINPWPEASRIALRARVEETGHLSHDELAAVCAAANGCRAAETLDQAEANLCSLFRGWFVYRGGNHVALHRRVNDSARVLMVTEIGGGR